MRPPIGVIGVYHISPIVIMDKKTFLNKLKSLLAQVLFATLK